jgi:predicted lipoprotein with Yx(FWY)xxD motif
MTPRRPITFLASAAVIPLVALAVAACGGGGAATAASPKTTPSNSATTQPATTPTTVIRSANTGLGRILVNTAGRTLYLFKADVGTKSACSGACASAWPPLLAPGDPTAGAGVTASKLGTTPRSDGTKQVTYDGHPLYLYIGDTKPGETNGQGVTAFGAAWFVVSPSGSQISSQSASPASGSSSSQAAKPAAPAPAPKPASPPAAKPAAPASNGIPQNGGGDDDSDNHGSPSDGDGNI